MLSHPEGEGEQRVRQLFALSREIENSVAKEKLVALNPFYQWIPDTKKWLRSNKEQLHPAVFDMAMRMLPGVAELHATDRPHLYPDPEGGLTFTWHRDADSPLCGMDIRVEPPCKPAEEYEQYNPWKPVHPPGVWNEVR